MPGGSEIGTVSLEVPTLPAGSLTGTMYLGGPDRLETAPITGPPYMIYVVANSSRYGVSVRLKGEVIPNEVTGQLTTVFKENPEQPFTSLTLHFNGGALTLGREPARLWHADRLDQLHAGREQASRPTHEPFGVSITGCGASIPFSLRRARNTKPPTGRRAHLLHVQPRRAGRPAVPRRRSRRRCPPGWSARSRR